MMTQGLGKLPGRLQESITVPQAGFLALLASSAARCYPSFELLLGARVEQLVDKDSVVHGVGCRHRAGRVERWYHPGVPDSRKQL